MRGKATYIQVALFAILVSWQVPGMISVSLGMKSRASLQITNGLSRPLLQNEGSGFMGKWFDRTPALACGPLCLRNPLEECFCNFNPLTSPQTPLLPSLIQFPSSAFFWLFYEPVYTNQMPAGILLSLQLYNSGPDHRVSLGVSLTSTCPRIQRFLRKQRIIQVPDEACCPGSCFSSTQFLKGICIL